MYEYTAAVCLALALVALADYRFGTRLYAKRGFAAWVLTCLGLQFVFDNWMAKIGFWHFNPSATLGVFVPYIPLENLLFGAALAWFAALVATRLSTQNALRARAST